MKSPEKLRLVFDTNVVLNALSPKLPFRSVLQEVIAGRHHLCVTTEILLEYEEKISEFYSPSTATLLLDALAVSNHVIRSEVFYRFNLLEDEDDNKFIDCAFAANAHYLISDDKGFRMLETVGFPRIEWLTLKRWHEILQET
ncbi:MAG: putative toxin-antitoxin system toxin component, PIN family [Saprospiraceae bacterium]